MDTLGSRIKEARLAANLSQEALARSVGVSQGLIGQIESGLNKGSKHITSLARTLNVSPDWLETGEGNRERLLTPAKYALPPDQGNVLVWERPDDLPPNPGRVWIDRYDYGFSAGAGRIQWEIRQKQALPFNISFLRAINVRPKDCKLVETKGDSMEPYLFNNDLMLVDETQTHIRDGKIYTIYFEDEPLVKQLFKEVGGGVRLHSYNLKYPDRLIPGDKLNLLVVVGRVVYRAGAGDL